MKVIIAGSRHINDMTYVVQALNKSGFLPQVTEVVSGGAQGVDKLGERWAGMSGVKVRCFPADWGKYGKSAGPIRNQEMLDYVSNVGGERVGVGGLIAVWDGKSKGTFDMIRRSIDAGLKVHVEFIQGTTCPHYYQGVGARISSGTYGDKCKICGKYEEYEKDYT